jgi:hypothetical protein
MIAEVVIAAIVVVFAAEALVTLKSVAKVAAVLEIAKRKNQFAHSVAQHQQSQSMKIAQLEQSAQSVLIEQPEMNVQQEKSVQLAPLELIDIQKQSDSKNLIVLQKQIALTLQNLQTSLQASHLSLIKQIAQLRRVINQILGLQLQLGAQIQKKLSVQSDQRDLKNMRASAHHLRKHQAQRSLQRRLLPSEHHFQKEPLKKLDQIRMRESQNQELSDFKLSTFIKF